MSSSDVMSLTGDVLAVIAIALASMIYLRQQKQTKAQEDQAEALANLEITEKLGTISSRAERLASIAGGETAANLDAREDKQACDDRAQIMYAVYDCLALDEVYPYASPAKQDKYRELLEEYWQIWERVPLLHASRFGYARNREISAAQFFHDTLHPFQDDPSPSQQPPEHPAPTDLSSPKDSTPQ